MAKTMFDYINSSTELIEECKKMVSHMEDSFKSDVFGVEKENCQYYKQKI